MNRVKNSEYQKWEALRRRCLRHNFENFLKDVGPRPEGLTLDRKNNNGNYEPGNCRWTTYKEQGANQRYPQRWFFGYNENTGCWLENNNQHEVAKELGLTQGNISSCLLGRYGYKSVKGWVFSWL